MASGLACSQPLARSPAVPSSAGSPRKSPTHRCRHSRALDGPAAATRAARGTAPQLLPYHFAVPQVEKRSPSSLMFDLPGDGNLVALTVDDGGDSDVVAAYARWIADTGMRVTFFLNGSLPAWTEQSRCAGARSWPPGTCSWRTTPGRTAIRPRRSNQQIVDDLMTNHEFIQSTYGVSAKPYYRPPFGRSRRPDAGGGRIRRVHELRHVVRVAGGCRPRSRKPISSTWRTAGCYRSTW